MRRLMWSSIAALAAITLVLAAGNVSRAQDIVRLGGPAAQASMTGDTDTTLVHGRYRGGYYGGGYRGGYYGGGYRGGYYGGYYGGYRSYYGGYYRPYVSVGYYGVSSYYSNPYYSYSNPYYCDSPAYYPTYYPTYYYRPTYRIRPAVYIRINGEEVPATSLQGNSQAAVAPPATLTPTNGTFPYDGDPRQIVPMPTPGAPTNPLPSTLPANGKLVSLPTETTGGTTQLSIVQTQRVNAVTTPAPRVSYPAYGDEPITPAPRKVQR